MNVENVPAQVQLGEAIAGQLKSAGIHVTLNPVEEVTLLKDFHSKTFTAGLTNSVAFPDPDTLYYRNFYSKSNNNQTGLDDPQLDKLLIEAQSAVQNSVRKKLYAEAQERLTGANGDFPQIPLYTPRPQAIVGQRLQASPVFPSTAVNAVGMWVAAS